MCFSTINLAVNPNKINVDVEDKSIDNLSDVDKMQHVQENLTKRSILCPIETMKLICLNLILF